jgi:hypothetical protein
MAALWSTGYLVSSSAKSISTSSGMEKWSAVTVWSSTLLGPEGMGASLTLLGPERLCRGCGIVRFGTARILRTAQWTRASIVVAKLIRAHGGCLGTRSRRRTLEPAISLGESATRHRSEDFRIGKPVERNCSSPLPEHIGQVEVTRGSETSQYPQEEKATAIPRVVVSESGRGQTNHVLKPAGVAWSG